MKRKIKSSCESAIIFILLGIMTLIFSELLAKSICIIIGAFALVYAAVKFIGIVKVKNALDGAIDFDWSFDLISAIVALIAGLVLVMNPGWILSLLHLAIGILIIVDSVFKIRTALSAKEIGLTDWWIAFVIALATCMLGVFLIIDPVDSIVMTVIGIALIVVGVQNLIEALLTNKIIKYSDNNDNPNVIETTSQDVDK